MAENFYKKKEKRCGRIYSFYEPITHYFDYVADSLPNDKIVADIIYLKKFSPLLKDN